MKKLCIALIALAVSWATPVIEASKMPYSEEALITSSEFIVVGQVLSMEKELMASGGNSGVYLWQVRISVSDVEKGLLDQSEITTTFNTSDGSTMVLCGPSQYPIPAVGNTVKAHLEAATMMNKGQQVYPALAPNGYQILAAETSGKDEVKDNTPLLRRIYQKIISPLIPFLVLGSMGYVFLRIRRKAQQVAKDSSGEEDPSENSES